MWFPNRFCLGTAALTWGCRPGNPDRVIADLDFISWHPDQFDTYSAPIDWALEPRARASSHIETWRINAKNTPRNSQLYMALNT